MLKKKPTLYTTRVYIGTKWAEGVEFIPRMTPDNLERSLNRTKGNLRRRLKELYHSAPKGKVWMVTLTFADEVYEYEDARREFREFLRRVRRYLGRPFRYIAVPELQKRGVWHWHVVVVDDIHQNIWAKLWGRGYVWVERFIGGIKRLSNYLTKYLTKELGAWLPKGVSRYLSSRGLVCAVMKKLAERGWTLERMEPFIAPGSLLVVSFGDIGDDTIWWEAALK